MKYVQNIKEQNLSCEVINLGITFGLIAINIVYIGYKFVQ